MIHVLGFASGRDGDVVADACVLINDRIFDPAIGADANARFAGAFVFSDGFFRFKVIATQGHDAIQFRARTDQHAQADDAVIDLRLIDDATVGDDRMIDLGAVHF